MSSQQSSSPNFFDPVLSVLGVITSILATLTPLFSSLYIQGLFIKSELAYISSIIAFIFSIIFIWSGMSNYQSFSLFTAFKNLFDFILKKLDNLFRFLLKKQPKIPNVQYSLSQPSVVTFEYVSLSTLCFFCFLSLLEYSKTNNLWLIPVFQSISYISFFSFLSYSFGIMFGQAKQKFEFEQKTKLFPRKIEDLLNEHGYIKPTIKIKENIQLSVPEQTKLGLIGFGYRKIKFETETGKKSTSIIVDNSGSQLIKQL